MAGNELVDQVMMAHDVVERQHALPAEGEDESKADKRDRERQEAAPRSAPTLARAPRKIVTTEHAEAVSQVSNLSYTLYT